MALFSYHPPLLRQPSHAARINERHWLARDIVFAHSGYGAFVLGRLVSEPAAPVRGFTASGGQHPGLNHSRIWTPDSTNYEEYPLGYSGLKNPLTISCWCFGPASTTTDGLVTLRREAGYAGGFMLTRHSTEIYSAVTANTSDVQSTGSSPGSASPFVANAWEFATGTWGNGDALRTAYRNGVSGTPGTGNRPGPLCDRIMLLANTAGVPVAANSAAISGIALPLVIARQLDDEEVARLHDEQRSNPWSLFTERPIWVPVSAAAQDYVRPQIHISRAAVTRASRW